jgi:NADH dehydrogenase
LAPDAHQSFADVHVEGAKAIATAAREEGIDRLVHISALGADADGAANYAVSKAEGEAAVLAEIPGAIILRPSVIFGAEDEFFNRFAAMARIVPLIPAIGGGRTRFQPVYVGDVAEAVANAVEGRAALGQIYELGGPEVLSFAEIVERIGKYTGRNVKPFPIPFVIAKAMAVLTSPLPGALRPFTYDQIKMLQGNSVVSDEAHSERRDLSALGIDTATSIDAVVPSYLEHYRPRGQYSHYRS